MSKRRSPDKRTRWPCIVARHRVGCPALDGKRCRCEPGYMARVWDPTRRRPVPSPTFRTPTECINWQQDTREALRSAASPLMQVSPPNGASPPIEPSPTDTPPNGISRLAVQLTVREVSDRFIVAIKDGTALNKKGKRYKESSICTIENALRGRIAEELGPVPVDDVRRGQVQTLIDEMVAERLSGSRVRNVVNALRSLYAYTIPRDLAQASPITNILLPAKDEKPRDRIATPLEFQELLGALEPDDAMPFALAAYATARSQEILNFLWEAVAWESEMLHLADEEEYEKSEAAKRRFPILNQLMPILRAEWERQGQPTGKMLVCPARKPGGRNCGRLSASALYTRADKAWEAKKLTPIRLQECRHTASSWMRAAGIDLKIRSVLMGHASTSSTDGGRGSITDDRYTHLLPGEIEQAGKQFEAYLTAQLKEEVSRRKIHKDM
jgi:integrase